MRRKPVIGVMPLYDDEKESIWMLPAYENALREAGAIPVILPRIADIGDAVEIDGMVDGYLFTGGNDINPALYGLHDGGMCGKVDNERDNLESLFFKIAYKNDKPALAICRGLQLMNVLMGGTLYRDLSTERKIGFNHTIPDTTQKVHRVDLVSESILGRLIDRKSINVNSYHHQAINKLGRDLRACAYSEDGIVEGIECVDKKFILGVQWHPEIIYREDASSSLIFKAFVKACKPKSFI